MHLYIKYYIVPLIAASVILGILMGGHWMWMGFGILCIVVIGGDAILGDDTSIPKYNDINARFIETELEHLKLKNKIKLICIYLPNGNPIDTEKFDYKIDWMEKFNNYIYSLKEKNIPVVIGGDFNVIPNDEDVYSPENYKNDACAHPLTREKFRYLLNLGFTDTGKHFIEGSSNWTFWGYRGGGWQKGNGLRIDHFLTSSEITDLIKSVEINREPRGWDKASDHTPISIKI